MTIQTETTTYRLNGETIDRIAEQVESFLTALGTERANIVRIRLSMEEVLLRRFLIMSSVITVVSLWILLFMPYFRIDNFEEQMRIKTFSDMMEMVFGIVPNDIITPFVNGDSPAIFFIALVTGNALLMAGSGSSLVVRVIEQADSVGLLLADWISSFSPWFITVLLVAAIGTNSVWEVLSVWKPLLAYAAMFHTLGIPDAALTGAVAADILFGFVTAAVDQAMLQLELVVEARRAGELNELVLKM